MFGNSLRIVSGRGAVFTSKDFEEYCVDQNIEHIKITTGVPRGNGQVKRMHSIMIAVLSKLAQEDRIKWYKYVPDVQKIINSLVSRSTKFAFELLTNVKMKNKSDLKIKEILNEECINFVMKEHEEIREARKNIMKNQEENKTQFNRSWKKI